MADRQLLVPDGSVGHDERCEAPRPGTDVSCRCAERAAVKLLEGLGYEVEPPPAYHNYELDRSGNRAIMRCVDCGTVWSSVRSRPPTNPCVPAPPPEKEQQQ